MVIIAAGGDQVEVSSPHKTLDQFTELEYRSESYAIRLEHLPPEEINGPPGRGRQTASSRGYDTERLIAEITGGTTDNTPSWYDVVSTTPCDTEYIEKEHLRLWECKCCIDEHPCGDRGSFRIWERNHEQLVEPEIWFNRDRHFDPEKPLFEPMAYYYFLIYTIIDEQPVEVGKISVSAKWMDTLISDWQFIRHDTMGCAYYVDIMWTTLLKKLNIGIHQLQWSETVTPELDAAPEGLY